jgi:hypothetical protein
MAHHHVSSHVSKKSPTINSKTYNGFIGVFVEKWIRYSVNQTPYWKDHWYLLFLSLNDKRSKHALAVFNNTDRNFISLSIKVGKMNRNEIRSFM